MSSEAGASCVGSTGGAARILHCGWLARSPRVHSPWHQLGGVGASLCDLRGTAQVQTPQPAASSAVPWTATALPLSGADGCPAEV